VSWLTIDLTGPLVSLFGLAGLFLASFIVEILYKNVHGFLNRAPKTARPPILLHFFICLLLNDFRRTIRAS
jgi:hypothetical protein